MAARRERANSVNSTRNRHDSSDVLCMADDTDDENYETRAAEALRNDRVPQTIMSGIFVHWMSQATVAKEEDDCRRKFAGLALRWHKWQWLMNRSNVEASAEIHQSFLRVRMLLRDCLGEETIAILHWVTKEEFEQLPADREEVLKIVRSLPLPPHLSDPSLQDQPAARERNLWGSLKDSPDTQKSHFWIFARPGADEVA